MTNSERRISRQRAFLTSPGEARADWWQLAQVARRMGFGEAFAWTSPAGIFDEHARLSAASNDGTRDFDIGGLAGLAAGDYDALEPVQWPVRRRGQTLGSDPVSRQTSHRFFADGRFYTPDGRARFVPTPVRRGQTRGSDPVATPSAKLVLNTGRIRDQWHTMTRTAKTPRLMSHISEPFVEVHPTDSKRLGLAPASIARLSSAHGTMLARVVVTDRQRQGSVFVPMHWTDQLAGGGRVDALVTAALDPVSGQPALKQTQVEVAPYPAHWFAVAVCRSRPRSIQAAYWAAAPISGGWRIEMADERAPADAGDILAGLAGDTPTAETETVAYHDRASRQHRLAAFACETPLAILYTAAEPVAVSRVWLGERLATTAIPAADRLRLLAGRAGAGQRDPGPIVCACFNVGRNDIAHAVATKGCATVAAVGAMTNAGTNCGSCRAEIGSLIDATRVAKAS